MLKFVKGVVQFPLDLVLHIQIVVPIGNLVRLNNLFLLDGHISNLIIADVVGSQRLLQHTVVGSGIAIIVKLCGLVVPWLPLAERILVAFGPPIIFQFINAPLPVCFDGLSHHFREFAVESRVNFAFPDNALVQVIDTLEGTVIDTLSPGRAVLHMEFTPRGEAVWVSARDDDRVTVYDTATRKALSVLPARAPSGIFFTARAARIGF